MEWTAEIMTDPARDHELHVELLEDGKYRARLYKDRGGFLCLHVYEGDEATMPVEWLLGIIAKFRNEIP